MSAKSLHPGRTKQTARKRTDAEKEKQIQEHVKERARKLLLFKKTFAVRAALVPQPTRKNIAKVNYAPVSNRRSGKTKMTAMKRCRAPESSTNGNDTGKAESDAAPKERESDEDEPAKKKQALRVSVADAIASHIAKHDVEIVDTHSTQ